MALASTPPPTLDIPTLAHTTPASGAVVWRTHVVRPGETLSHLAVAHHTTVRAIAQHNDLSAADFIVPGQRVKVPVAKGKDAPRRSRAAHGTAHRSAPSVRVRSGDTLSEIALRAGVSVRSLMAANHISDPRLIQPGQRLTLPGSASPRATTVRKKERPVRVVGTVVVRSGETLSAIALREGTTVSALLKANGLHDPRLIRPGQRLRVTTSRTHDSSTSSPTTRSPRATSRNTFEGRTYSDEVVASADANRRALARHRVPDRLTTGAMIERVAHRHGVDPRLAKAIAWQESGWNQRQVSVANAIGVMQVIPSTGGWVSDLVGHELNLLDTEDNIEAGVVLLRTLDRSATSEEEAIAGYYQGLAGVRQNGMYPDTKRYVANVQYHKSRM